MAHVDTTGPCVPIGTWVAPATHERLTTPEAIDRAAASRIVLLGEEHTRSEDHLWQLQTIAALHGRRQHMVLGFEMFPRTAQPVLDQWVAGELDERRFLAESGWKTFWQFPADLYLPIFRFARMNHVPMLALNVPRGLVSRVAEEGWDKVPPQEREGLSQPSPPSPEYHKSLAETYQEHIEEGRGLPHTDLSRFVAAQLVWDRAFAEALHAALQARPDALVIGLIGSGHLEHGYGVPHQLASLGIADVTVLLPWTESRACADLVPDLADAVFGVPVMGTERARPILGVQIEPVEGGVAVRRVSPESVAAAAGIRDGDLIIAAAGFAVQTPGDLQDIVARQAPGTWLPLCVRRGAQEIEIVARFPGDL
jgi:uncharacterized iron-regulated protein